MMAQVIDVAAASCPAMATEVWNSAANSTSSGASIKYAVIVRKVAAKSNESTRLGRTRCSVKVWSLSQNFLVPPAIKAEDYLLMAGSLGASVSQVNHIPIFAGNFAQHRSVELAGDRVRIEFGPRSEDRYSRALFYVYTEAGESVAEKLIQEGLGKAWERDGQHRNLLMAVKGGAERDGNRGLC